MIRPVLIALALATPAAAQSVQVVTDQAKADCALLDNGSFSMDPEAVIERDLNGDGKADTLVDSTYFHCSTSESYWGGTAGNSLVAIVDGQQTEFFAQDWQVIEWNALPVLLLWHNGGDCGGSGAEPCAEALVWSDYRKAFMSVALPPEN